MTVKVFAESRSLMLPIAFGPTLDGALVAANCFNASSASSLLRRPQSISSPTRPYCDRVKILLDFFRQTEQVVAARAQMLIVQSSGCFKDSVVLGQPGGL